MFCIWYFQIHSWLLNHPGRVVTEAEIAQLFANAYGRAATLSNASSAFRKTGIHPFNPNVFTADDFIASDVTDNPMPSAEMSHAAAVSMESVSSELMDIDKQTSVSIVAGVSSGHEVDSGDLVAEVSPIDAVESRPPNETVDVSSMEEIDLTNLVVEVIAAEEVHSSSCSTSVAAADVNVSQPSPVDAGTKGPTDDDMVNTVQINSTPAAPGASSAAESARRSFNDLIPTPKSTKLCNGTRKKRAVSHAVVVTSSPFKKALEDAKLEKKRKMKTREAKTLQKRSETKPKTTRKTVRKETKGKTHVLRPTSKKSLLMPEDDDDDDQPLSALIASNNSKCKHCKFQYGDESDPKKTEDWIKCSGCNAWLHDSCAELYGVYDNTIYVCQHCL